MMGRRRHGVKLEAEGVEGRAVAECTSVQVTRRQMAAHDFFSETKSLCFTSYSDSAKYWKQELLCHGMGAGVIVLILEVN